MLYVGTYTPGSEPAGRGEGVYRVWFDPNTGEFEDGGVAARLTGPSYLALNAHRPWIYAVGERAEGTVTALRIEYDGGLTELGSEPSHGSSPCHVLALGDHEAVVANYADGRVAVAGFGPDGGRRSEPDVYSGEHEPWQLFEHTGHGPDPDRQEGPHAHSSLLVPDTVDPDLCTLLVADLGTDELRAYRVGEKVPPETGEPSEGSGPGMKFVPGGIQGRVRLAPGSGPRHMALSQDGRHVYVTGELDSRVHVVRWTGDIDHAQYLGSVPATAEEAAGTNFPAELALHRDRLYVCNRGADAVSTFALRDGGARPEHLADTPVGAWPRHFAVVRGHRDEPDHLVAAAQNGGSLMSLRLDPETGIPADTGHRLALPDPVCVLPVPLRRIRRGQRPGG
ncbi:lactonase family protein [Nocardiopsis sp. HNM0947]|uniref:Lactonase family protein n=1 Tax=Nocardiopsis coralli TaxID=2772213 RepID=A0ABR9PAR8_9ACTN|nr:lactonase family protein [Nocardiopsis coralli]MBE3000785.1 lactonase family protein [Nocardiopsis coralli]